MDSRQIARINMKFGKFLDPFLILTIILVLSLSLLSVKNLSPKTISNERNQGVLGVTESENPTGFNLISGEHKYITSETLKEIKPNYFKYTAFIKKPPKGRVSKPIIEVKNLEIVKIQLHYINSITPKIAIFQETKGINHIIQESNKNYMTDIRVDGQNDVLYLSVENTTLVFFDQYLEINFFLNP